MMCMNGVQVNSGFIPFCSLLFHDLGNGWMIPAIADIAVSEQASDYHRCV